MLLRASASGAWDDKGGDELVHVGAIKGKLTVQVMTKDHRRQNNGWGTLLTKELPRLPSSDRVFGVSACMGDIDDDGLQEILLLFTYKSASFKGYFFQRVMVLDDARTKGTLILDRVQGSSGRLNQVSIHTADFDGDGKDEILLARWQSSYCSILLMGDRSTGFKARNNWSELGETRQAEVLSLQVGNMDRDAEPEVAVTFVEKSLGKISGVRSKIFDLSSQGKPTLHQTLVQRYPLKFVPGAKVRFALSADLNGDRVKEILCFGFQPLSFNTKTPSLFAIHLVPRDDRGVWEQGGNFISSSVQSISDPLSSAVVLDDDGDHRDEILLGLKNGDRGPTLVYRYEMSKVYRKNTYFLGSPKIRAYQSKPVANAIDLTPGDFDGENLLLERTGKKWLTLPDPIPIVLLAAPPTKKGISQNFSGSSTAYSVSQGKTTSHSVQTQTTITLREGKKAAYGDLFEFSVQATLSYSVAETLTKAVTITKTNAFSGTYDKDVIVFQGTLYMRYQYRIIRSRDAKEIGKLFTIDEPVSTRIYKWTVDFYNKNVPARSRIGKDVITHTIGDPQTYMRKSQAKALLGIPGSWIHEKGLTVGQGRSTNSISIGITKQNSNAQSRSFGVRAELSWQIGPRVGGATYGINRSEVYSVSINEGTLYSGTIGDIDKGQDFSDWFYAAGLFVRRIGVDAKGNTLPGKLPYQLVTWWTQPLGTNYK
ncbi:MAG TPA: VCBS repeat-containing protein [Planctomycetes bacterium]|nr:VCBS repeat-containing protein [Planctomycetota bacterium]